MIKMVNKVYDTIVNYYLNIGIGRNIIKMNTLEIADLVYN